MTIKRIGPGCSFNQALSSILSAVYLLLLLFHRREGIHERERVCVRRSAALDCGCGRIGHTVITNGTRIQPPKSTSIRITTTFLSNYGKWRLHQLETSNREEPNSKSKIPTPRQRTTRLQLQRVTSFTHQCTSCMFCESEKIGRFLTDLRTWIFFSNLTILFNKWLIDTANFRKFTLSTIYTQKHQTNHHQDIVSSLSQPQI